MAGGLLLDALGFIIERIAKQTTHEGIANMSMVKFELKGPRAGQTIGFSKDLKGIPRYSFKNGIMEVHASRVNGRFITRMAREYNAHLEGQANGSSEVQADGNDSGGSQEMASDLRAPIEFAAAGDAIQLTGDVDSEAGSSRSANASGSGSSSAKTPKRK
jgi:hypothetical protein